jgi:hypothetical protein
MAGSALTFRPVRNTRLQFLYKRPGMFWISPKQKKPVEGPARMPVPAMQPAE